jgi:hypothetical protein
MLDPISALGAAAAAIQFLDYMTKCLSSMGRMLVKGQSKATRDADLAEKAQITRVIAKMNDQMLKSLSKLGDDEGGEIKTLCNSCNQVAEELLTSLSDLSLHGESWGSGLQKVLKAPWTEQRVEALRAKLNSYREQVNFCVLVLMR